MYFCLEVGRLTNWPLAVLESLACYFSAPAWDCWGWLGNISHQSRAAPACRLANIIARLSWPIDPLTPRQRRPRQVSKLLEIVRVKWRSDLDKSRGLCQDTAYSGTEISCSAALRSDNLISVFDSTWVRIIPNSNNTGETNANHSEIPISRHRVPPQKKETPIVAHESCFLLCYIYFIVNLSICYC